MNGKKKKKKTKTRCLCHSEAILCAISFLTRPHTSKLFISVPKTHKNTSVFTHWARFPHHTPSLQWVYLLYTSHLNIKHKNNNNNNDKKREMKMSNEIMVVLNSILTTSLCFTLLESGRWMLHMYEYAGCCCCDNLPVLQSHFNELTVCVCVCGSGCSGTSSSQGQLWEVCAYVCVSFFCAKMLPVPNPGKVFEGKFKVKRFFLFFSTQ